MTYDVYMHFPVLAIMTLFVGAFLVTLAGKRETLRNLSLIHISEPTRPY